MKRKLQHLKHRRRPVDTRKRTLSDLQTAVSVGGQQDTKALPALPSLKLISTLEQLRLNDFIDCCVDNKYNALVLQGEATPEQLQDTWVTLITKYNEIVAPGEAAKGLDLSVTIEQLTLKIGIVTSLLNAIELQYNLVIAAELNEWGYVIPMDADKQVKAIKTAYTLLGNDKTRLAIAQKQYAETQGKPTKQTRESYTKMLLQIGKHRGQHYRATELNTYEFALMYRELLDYSDYLAKQKLKNGR